MSDNLARPPRFPYVAALLCAACVGAAAWTWMRYSYAWGVEAADLQGAMPGQPDLVEQKRKRWKGRFARAEGVIVGERQFDSYRDRGWRMVLVGTEVRRSVPVVHPSGYDSGTLGTSTVVTGRLRAFDELCGHTPDFVCVGFLALDPTSGRMTGASIAGLVVGAMGVFVFTVALRHWLRERRKLRERDEGA